MYRGIRRDNGRGFYTLTPTFTYYSTPNFSLETRRVLDRSSVFLSVFVVFTFSFTSLV